MNPTKQNWKLQRPTPTGLHIVTDDAVELPIATVFLPQGGGTPAQRDERQEIAELIAAAPRLRKAARLSRAASDWHDARTEKPDTDTTVILGFEDGETAHGYWCSETECWRTTDALPADGVTFWMHCPEVPKD